jgi:hypothetical protein
MQRSLNFAKLDRPHIRITKADQDVWEDTLPRKVYAFLLYSIRRTWLFGHTFFRYIRAAERFKVSVRTIQRWMRILLEQGIVRRIKRTGHGDHFQVVENSGIEPSNPPQNDVSDTTKMSGRIKGSYREEIRGTMAEPVENSASATIQTTEILAQPGAISPSQTEETPPKTEALKGESRLEPDAYEIAGIRWMDWGRGLKVAVPVNETSSARAVKITRPDPVQKPTKRETPPPQPQNLHQSAAELPSYLDAGDLHDLIRKERVQGGPEGIKNAVSRLLHGLNRSKANKPKI